MYLNTIEDLKDCLQNNSNSYQKLEDQEFLSILDEFLYGETREVYIKIKMGIKVYKNEFNKLLAKIKEIIDE